MKKEVKMEDRIAGYRAEYKKKLDKISIKRIGEKYDNLSISQIKEILLEYKKTHSDYLVQPENVSDASKLEELIEQIPLGEDSSDSSHSKFTVLTNETEIANAQNTFVKNLKKYTTKKASAVIGFPGPEKKVTGDVDYISTANFWWYTRKLVDEATPRYWNCFGPGEPNWGKNNSIVLEINPPIKGTSRRTKAAFVKDQDGNVYLTHNGVLGGGNTPGGFYDVYPHEDRWIDAEDGRDEPRELILISDITSSKLPEFLADYIENVAKYKSGELISKKVPFYLLLRHKSEDNPYEDDPSGKVYHFPKIANYTKVVPSAKAIWFDRKDGDYYFWGFGTISEVKPRSDNDNDAIFDDFTFFKKEPDSLELLGKFLKKATPQIQEKIMKYPGWNMQNSILEIGKEIFDEVVDTSGIKTDDPFEVGHNLFLIEMSQREHKIPFENFEHIDFVEIEINYKKQALEKSLEILSIDQWDEWKSTPEKICQAVRDATALKISENLVWSPPFNTEKGYFDELNNAIKSKFGNQLYDFFKGDNSIDKRFDDLVSFLEKNNIYIEMRLLAYLMFLLDSKKYFPIHPTNFDKLLEFYEIQNIKEKSWKKYSLYLELAAKLKSRLTEKFPSIALTAIQVQSYMWVIAGAVSKNYWLVRPGSGGEDWENQKQAGLVGIHYYTMDLLKFTTQNKQLSKPKTQKRMREIRQEQGKDPDPQPAMDADFGQLSRIFSVRRKDKILAIEGSTLLGIGNATGKYQFRTDISEYCHTVPVDWYDVNSRQIPQQGFSRAIKELSVKNYVNIMSSQTTTQASQYQEFFDILNRKKQFIFYGPPGTGKTFTAKKIAEEFTKQTKIQNFDDDEYNNYVDKMIETAGELEGFTFKKESDNYILLKNSEKKIRIYADYSKSGKTTPHDCYVGISNSAINYLNQTKEENRFVLIVNNDVKNFVIIPHEFIKENVKLSAGENWDESGTDEHSFHVHVYNDQAQFRANENYSEKYANCNTYLHNIGILFDKNAIACSKIENVTFHQSFSYEEFIEGIRPQTDESKTHVIYPIEDGIFKRFCKCAKIDPANNFIMIIDEINRGNISKIFGELITIIEKDKRDQTVKLPYSKKLFSIPENLYVIGTRNTADRSLVHIDAALKRRFGNYELMPDSSILKNKKINRIHLGKLLDAINGKILDIGMRDNQIGHSYFMNGEEPYDKIIDLQYAFALDILPSLKDTFYDDEKPLRKILGNQFIDDRGNIIPDWRKDPEKFEQAIETAFPECIE